jgi:thioredoxin reductase (NADPH)
VAAAEPVIVVVDGDRERLAALEAALRRRFGADYRVLGADTPAGALDALARLADDAERVALVVADQWLPGTTGVDLLARAHQRHPAARRALLIGYGDAVAGDAWLRAMALGQVDYYLNTPWGSPELQLYPVVGELLSQWAGSTAGGAEKPELVQVVAPRHAARSHELRDLLGRNNIPHRFYDADTDDGRRLLAGVGPAPPKRPVLLLFDGRVLVDPTNEQLADALGARTRPGSDRYDVAVVGAGPAGLAAATYAASEGLRTLLLEGEAVGGQAGTTSLIRNYLGFPRGIGGGELAARAAEQAVVFGAELVYTQTATGLEAGGPDRILTLADGSRAVSRTVVISTGVSYRRLPVPGIGDLVGSGVFYGAAVTEARAMAGARVFVVGGANSAGQAAVHLARYADRVTLLVRGGSLAAGMSSYLVVVVGRAGNVDVRLRAEVTAVHGAGRLAAITVADRATGATQTVPAAALFILIGAAPHTGWLAGAVERDERGFVRTGADLLVDGAPPAGWPLRRPPLLLETSLPGVFAAGDVRLGSVKRVASAVGEGAIAIQLVHRYLGER